MTPHEIKILAAELAKEMPVQSAPHQCRFSDNTITLIEGMAQTYLTARKVARWAGALFAGSLILSAAGGFLWVLVFCGKLLFREAARVSGVAAP